MTEKKKPPPGEYSAFKELLGKIAKVPKDEINKEERKYQEARKQGPRKQRAVHRGTAV